MTASGSGVLQNTGDIPGDAAFDFKGGIAHKTPAADQAPAAPTSADDDQPPPLPPIQAWARDPLEPRLPSVRTGLKNRLRPSPGR